MTSKRVPAATRFPLDDFRGSSQVFQPTVGTCPQKRLLYPRAFDSTQRLHVIHRMRTRDLQFNLIGIDRMR